jgi:peroxiredoxin
MACHQMAPGLVQAQRKYRDRGVAFVGLTADPLGVATSFVEQNAIGWPCGYGAALEDIARWGVYNPSRFSGTYDPGYEVSPTLFLIGPDGRILWCDGQARPRHSAGEAELLRGLGDAIEAALKDSPPSP